VVLDDGVSGSVAPGRVARATVPAVRLQPAGHGSPAVVVVTLDETTLPSGLVELRSAVAATVRSGARTLVVDVSRLGRLSSPTVTALLWAQRRCRVQGGAVVLRGADRRWRRLLRRTGLADVFDLEPPGAAAPEERRTRTA
jgi:anti-anti-sigma factor